MSISILKKGITAKLFWVTTGLLIITTVAIYLITYALLPRYYYVYKRNHLQSQIQLLVQQVNGMDLSQAGMIMDRFTIQNNLKVMVTDNQGTLIYPDPLVPINGVPASFGGGSIVVPANRTPKPLFVVSSSDSSDGLTASHPLELSGMPKLLLTVISPLQPISEASHVLLLFLPYMLLVALVVSVTGSTIYSMVVTRPLLKLNSVAKRMASLDFTTVPTLARKDEIGELSFSLTELAANLQQTLRKLENANQQLKSDIERERELEVKRREFVATISHELKSPLTAVLGQLEAMIGRIGVYQDRDKYLRQSYTLMKTMEKLVHEILEVSKMDRPEFSPCIKRMNIKRLVTLAIEDNSYFATEKEILIYQKIEDVPEVLADETLVKQAIHNVLLNAIQYSPVNAEVRVKLTKEDDVILVTIENTGVHIHKDQLDKVFDPFYRIEKSRNRQTGGSGLGLYIVKRTLEVQEIPYRLENTDDGVRFTVYLKRV